LAVERLELTGSVALIDEQSFVAVDDAGGRQLDAGLLLLSITVTPVGPIAM
jgi:hypothetical protein